MVIGVIGSRRRNTGTDYSLIYDAVMSRYTDGDQLVSGGCPQGADAFAERIARTKQIPIKIHYAKWDKFGKSAGFRRNGAIAQEADILIACVAPDRTGGTEDTIKKFCASLTSDKVWTEAEKIEMGELILV